MGNKTSSHHKSHHSRPPYRKPFQEDKKPPQTSAQKKFKGYFAKNFGPSGGRKVHQNRPEYDQLGKERGRGKYAHQTQDELDYPRGPNYIEDINQHRMEGPPPPKMSPYPINRLPNYHDQIGVHREDEVHNLKRKVATLERENEGLVQIIFNLNKKVEDLEKAILNQNKKIEQTFEDLKARMAVREIRSKKKSRRAKTEDVDFEAASPFHKKDIDVGKNEKASANPKPLYPTVEILDNRMDTNPHGGNKEINLETKLPHNKMDIDIRHEIKEENNSVNIFKNTSKHDIDNWGQEIKKVKPSKKKRKGPILGMGRSHNDLESPIYENVFVIQGTKLSPVITVEPKNKRCKELVPGMGRSNSDLDLEPESFPIFENVFGIEGRNNSCYMDSSFNSMFLFTTVFKEFLENDPALILSNGNSTASDGLKNERNVDKVRKILYEEIVTPLNNNKTLRLDTGAMAKFRKLLSKFNASFDGNEMDPEEFISTLFGSILKTSGFYLIDGDDEGSYVFQTYADMTKPRDEIDVQSLLEYSFKESQIQLESIPSPGFIIKMPVTDGRHMFKKVHPNLTIDLKNILKKKDLFGIETKMQLSAVICLSSHHFTAYVRERVTKSSPWWYLDSFSSSKAKNHLDMDKALENRNRSLDRQMSLLTANCYMCLYLPISSA